MRLSVRRPVLALLLALSTAFVPLASQASSPVAPAPDYAALVGDFPHPGSDGALADQAILLWLQRSRTREEISRARTEVEVHFGIFSAVAGKDLDSGAFPLTHRLLEDAQKAQHQIIGPLKLRFARPRPYLAIAQLAPALPLEPTFSYPSGHSTWAMMEASVLAQLEPKAKEAILERGRQVGFDRCLGGVHYPSDVDAGQRLGAAIAQAWLADPALRLRLDQARAAEWN